MQIWPNILVSALWKIVEPSLPPIKYFPKTQSTTHLNSCVCFFWCFKLYKGEPLDVSSMFEPRQAANYSKQSNRVEHLRHIWNWITFATNNVMHSPDVGPYVDCSASLGYLSFSWKVQAAQRIGAAKGGIRVWIMRWKGYLTHRNEGLIFHCKTNSWAVKESKLNMTDKISDILATPPLFFMSLIDMPQKY